MIKKYYFINKFDTNNIDKQDKQTAIIYRNYLTKDYKPTAGCIALRKKDFLIMLKLIKKNSKIKIF